MVVLGEDSDRRVPLQGDGDAVRVGSLNAAIAG